MTRVTLALATVLLVTPAAAQQPTQCPLEADLLTQFAQKHGERPMLEWTTPSGLRMQMWSGARRTMTVVLFPPDQPGRACAVGAGTDLHAVPSGSPA